jgi:hypothetical protein
LGHWRLGWAALFDRRHDVPRHPPLHVRLHRQHVQGATTATQSDLVRDDRGKDAQRKPRRVWRQEQTGSVRKLRRGSNHVFLGLGWRPDWRVWRFFRFVAQADREPTTTVQSKPTAPHYRLKNKPLILLAFYAVGEKTGFSVALIGGVREFRAPIPTASRSDLGINP